VFGWLAEGSLLVQQQALRDYAQAIANYFAGTHRKPTWRKAGRDEGFLSSGWGLLVRRLEDKAPAGSRRSIPRTPASSARRAGMSQRRAARAKPSSTAQPADTPATRT
jgi:hypothetical protein